MDDRMAKARIPIPDGTWHGATAEWLWVQKLGPDTARIANIPAYATGLAVDDHVRLSQRDHGLVVVEVVRRSGHSTFHIVFDDAIPPKAVFSRFWDPLERLGCRYERGDEPAPVIAIDVPPDVDPEVVFTYLSEAEGNFGFQFEDAYMHSAPN